MARDRARLVARYQAHGGAQAARRLADRLAGFPLTAACLARLQVAVAQAVQGRAGAVQVRVRAAGNRPGPGGWGFFIVERADSGGLEIILYQDHPTGDQAPSH